MHYHVVYYTMNNHHNVSSLNVERADHDILRADYEIGIQCIMV